MSDKLRIFVSGNESELDNERATAMKIIKSLGFDPVGSENRTASSDSIESEYIGEVESSDFYLGIFGKMKSDATRKEFEKARSTGKCTLVFQKNIHSTEREPELEEFLNKIKDPASGVVYLKYDNSVDLETAIINSLSYYVTKKFRELKKLQEQENVRTTKKLIETNIIKKSQSEKISKFPFNARFSKDFGKAEFTKFKIISELEKGKEHFVLARVEGSTYHGFLDLAIKDPEGNYHWFPNPESYDSTNDNGNLFFEDYFYERQWMFKMPNMSGKYLALMGLYENKYENREVVNFEIQEFTLS